MHLSSTHRQEHDADSFLIAGNAEAEQSSGAPKSAPTSEYVRSNAQTWWLYAADWATVIIVTAVSQLIIIPWPGSVRFIVTDPNIQQEYSANVVDIVRVCVVLMTAVPVVAMLVWLGYHRRPLHEFHHAILGLANALSFCILFTNIFKQVNNDLSPDFIDRCKPSPGAFEQALRTGASLSYHDCTGEDIKQGIRQFPTVSIAISTCSMAYLSLFASIQFGLHVHPSARRQLQAMSSSGSLEYSRPGQTLASFICLLPIAAGLAFPAVETKYHGGGHGWGYMFGCITGLAFALWAHALYCSDMAVTALLSHHAQ
ncbi:hypothetical protein GQ54DRAFT_281737 [Martensiomyces pterosporus]|nr:hypothetical protein GQ54DRAFT_281737 [Martensiomyces pterosporus]